ncbi:MAG: PQQ-binding-like beta-propeller repeat protein [Acidobacteria bacterium]|nr:PQQ-binding-like beta-propeller repeat protein [Acidobacteriota bacterium]
MRTAPLGWWAGTLLFSLVFLSSIMGAQTAAPAPADGKKIFSTQCGICHGADARGGEYGPALAGNNDLRGRPVTWIRDTIRNGIPAAGMPAFPLNAQDLDALAAFVHSLNAPAGKVTPAGDRAAGEQYFSGKGRCSTCHMVWGSGSPVGPDLSDVASHLSLPEIRESLLQPSAKITPGYGSVTVQLRNGETLRGFARSRTNFQIVLQDLQGQLHMLPQEEIASITEPKESAMPAMSATPEEIENLIAYLSGLNGEVAKKKGSEPDAKDFLRILQAAPGNWLTYNGNLSGNRYSELKMINTANVQQLTLKWIYTVPLWQQYYPNTSYYKENLSYFGLETVPLEADGVLYATGPQQAYALDAKTGQQIWKYSRPMPPGLVGDPSLGTNRGPALLGDKLFMVTGDAHMIALNRTTGALVWETVMPEKPMHYGATVAPLVVKDMVIGGVAGGDWGIRGFLAAYRVSDGKLMWRRWTVPDKNDPEAKTWGGNPPETGGAATWVTGSYDAETDTLFWTTGNPYPDSDNSERPGDNLYANCILALDPATGKIKWFYQVSPEDVHDWDANAPAVLVNTDFQGKPRKLLLYANKNGFFYVFDRTDGHLLVAKPIVKINWASGIGPDGRPQRLAENGVLCPEAGTNWGGTAFSPTTQWYYLIAHEKCDVDFSAVDSRKKQIEIPEDRKYLQAMNIQDGTIAWRIPLFGDADGKRNGGILATAGGLLFYGDPSGNVVAADAQNGQPLWHFPTNGENKTSPITYTIDGKQYVVLAVGPNLLAFGLQ